MKKNTRNVILALVLLAVLIAIPFWPNLRQTFLQKDSSAKTISCTVSVTCQDLSLVAQLQNDGITLDQDGVLLSSTVSVGEGETILGALEQAAEEKALTIETQGTPAYVTAIGGLAAGDHGDMSGWTYTVNGEMVMESCDVQTVQAGDEILWSYVTSWD